MLRSALIFASIIAVPAFAKEVRAKDALIQDGYLFLESATQNKLLTIAEKTETVVASRADNTMTSGIPIRSWVIKTRWIDDANGRRAALQKAISARPEWEAYAKDREELTSAYCSFRLNDPDIKVAQGDRESPLTSTSELCTYVVHTRNNGEEKLLAALKSNTLIDSGIAPITVRVPGSSRTVFDAQQISDIVRSLAVDTSRQYTEREAGIYLGISLLQYAKDLGSPARDELLDARGRNTVLKALDQTFDRIFVKVSQNPALYRFQALSEPTPVTLVEDQILKFDPQKKDTVIKQ